MSRLILGAMLAVLTVGSATAQGNLWGGACRLVGYAVLSGGPLDENVTKSIALCNADPEAVSCLATKRVLARNGKSEPRLSCSAAPAPPEAQIADAEKKIYFDVFENFCAMAATGILTGVAVGDLTTQVALCNKHPDKKSCETTKEFVTQRNHGDTRGLTCQ